MIRDIVHGLHPETSSALSIRFMARTGQTKPIQSNKDAFFGPIGAANRPIGPLFADAAAGSVAMASIGRKLGRLARDLPDSCRKSAAVQQYLGEAT
ncbi:hypothetical protein [Accumulibacter sp.]|uniref:hypothetical protein n=1 Tax=Accumulibacter sp. TaxID=2053492 RepID=UPI001AC90BB2|nr:hypothetical protein [Accumulibacter sp.]MBN8453668.1 hypothetical protein [Accumulibacter sp.]